MTTLRVQRRNMETKAKKLRREGYVTGNLFGKEIESLEYHAGLFSKLYQRLFITVCQIYAQVSDTDASVFRLL